MASLIGIGPSNQVILVPNEFDKIQLDSNEGGITIYKDMYNGGAFSQFTQDTNYYTKNELLPTYIEYYISA